MSRVRASACAGAAAAPRATWTLASLPRTTTPCVGRRHPPGEHSPLARNVCRKVDSIQRDLAQVQSGWFHVGRWRGVSTDACYVGRCGDCYVWVGPDGREQLTEFTLTVLKLSALIKETQTLISPGSVKFSPGDRGGG